MLAQAKRRAPTRFSGFLLFNDLAFSFLAAKLLPMKSAARQARAVPHLFADEALFALWHDLASFRASQSEPALRHLMEWIAREVNADNVIWVGAVRVLEDPKAVKADPFFGWRLRARQPLQPDPEEYQRVLREYYEPEHYGKLTPTYHSRSHATKMDHIGMTGRASLAGAGKFRVHCLRDKGWIDYKAWKRTPNYKIYYSDPGIIDRMTIGFPVSAKCESFFLIDRVQKKGGPRRRPFTRKEAKLAGGASLGAHTLHRQLFLGNGLLMGDKRLSPMEKRILGGLLDGLTEKEIAAATGQKFATTHKYVKALYSLYGVQSRASLMALWLRGS
jgi:DNA-binding CsgD family transcriptional regulator